jgi:hypothetical protein
MHLVHLPRRQSDLEIDGIASGVQNTSQIAVTIVVFAEHVFCAWITIALGSTIA